MTSSADEIIVFFRKVLLGEQTFLITHALALTNERRADLIDMQDEYGNYAFEIMKGEHIIEFLNLVAPDVAGHGLKTYALFEDVFQRLSNMYAKKIIVRMIVGKRADLHDWFTQRKYRLVSKGNITYAEKEFVRWI